MPIPKTHSTFTIFGFSALVTVATLLAVFFGIGPSAALVALILIAVEVSFSFDNAIINARILARLSPAWQQVFLTAGIVVAVIGMRVLLPIAIVALTAHISWGQVLDLALHHPEQYAHKLELAHPTIAAFGGSFLLMLALRFFIDDNKRIFWINRIEEPLAKIGKFWVPGILSLIVVGALGVLPANHHKATTLFAGLLGIATYVGIQLLMAPLEAANDHSKGGKHLNIKASLLTLLYLEILDASFSFDGVIGAFAITNKVILIAAGLGVGAVWVRSLTVFMVRRKTLDNYIYLEHGAHYTVGLLAVILLTSLFIEIPDAVTGLAGLLLIGASIFASKQDAKH